jgi:hypothetical protein
MVGMVKDICGRRLCSRCLVPQTVTAAAQSWPCQRLWPSDHLPRPSAPPKWCYRAIPSPSLMSPLAFNSHNRRTYGHQDRPLSATVGLPRPHASSAFAPIKRVPRPRLSSFTHWFLSSMPQHSCLRAPPTATSIHHRPVEIAASSLVFITGEHTLTCPLFLDHHSELLCPAMAARAHYG